MKKLIKSFILVAFFVGMTSPAWGQASTQGKEFWVSSTIVSSPNNVSAAPYIAISAEKACTVNIQGGVGNAINISQQVAAGSWNEFGNNVDPEQTNPNAGRVIVHMDASKWYPVAQKDPSTICNLAGQTNAYGLHITATENISVYVVLRADYSMDASNILPVNALGLEYYVQDYVPEAHNNSSAWSNAGNMVTMTTILATEDGTQIDITPKGNTYDGHQNGQLYTISLNKGETYYLISQKEKQLAGTHIVAKNNKKIAIFTGIALTRLPNGISARDALFEQPMPVEYWGTEFIVTRSLEKNGNLIGITATEPNTWIKVDGYVQATINTGETYYIMLQGSGDPNGRDAGTSPINQVITADVTYIETRCPCAVFSYDTGNSYRGRSNDEVVNGHGDPSSVWVSPIQQKINAITFGTCVTNKTKDHFLNIVTETATCQNTKLIALHGINSEEKTSLFSWIPVPGNTAFSYARVKISGIKVNDTSAEYTVFRLENPKGFIATIYGNGDDESYAYSAGSAAVEQGVMVDGETFTEGYRSDSRYCINSDLEFDAKVGTDIITRVNWDFGDGTTDFYGSPKTTHTYTTPGWYDVTAELYGHQVCTEESTQSLGAVHFSFRVVRQDTLYAQPAHHCIDVDSMYNGRKLTAAEIADLIANGANDTTEEEDCLIPVYITPVSFGMDTKERLDTIIGYDQAVGYNGTTYYTSQEVSDTVYPVPNSKQCTEIKEYFVKVITCADFSITSFPQHICPGEDLMNVEYKWQKGDIDSVRFYVKDMMSAVVVDTTTIPIADYYTDMTFLNLPAASILKPGKYNGHLMVYDTYCENYTIPIDFAVYYSADVFRYKFNNVLAMYSDTIGKYQFSRYEWHLIPYSDRTQDIVIGTNNPVVYLGDGVTFEIGDEVYVILTNSNGTLPSCTYRIEDAPDYTPADKSQAPARKLLIDNHFVIQKGNDIYDIYGQKVQ